MYNFRLHLRCENEQRVILIDIMSMSCYIDNNTNIKEQWSKTVLREYK